MDTAIIMDMDMAIMAMDMGIIVLAMATLPMDTGLRGKLNLLLRLTHCSNGMDTLDTDMDIMATDLDTMAMAITMTTLSMYTTSEGKREMQNL